MTRSKSRRAKRSGLLEASLFHMRQGDVFETVRRLARRLDDERLDYAVVGGLAVAEHGYVRATEGVDILMRREGRVAFPDPAAVAVDGEDFRYIRLETLIELKLADRLDPSVREPYLRLWEQAQRVPPGE